MTNLPEIKTKPCKPAYKKPEAVRELERMAMDEAKRKHPTCPHLAPRKYSDKTANGLTRAIIDFIKLSGYQAERINCTGRYLDGHKVVTDCLDRKMVIGSGHWLPTSGQKGTADISATINGRSVKIEVKMRDKQSQDQKRYQDAIERAGGLYWICRSFDEFLEHYNRMI
jgi:hypothetical protein